MRRLTKKIAASALALSLVFTMGTQCFAANWGSYFGGSQGWSEGAEGTLTSNTDKAWTAQMASIGYGGAWGAQVYKNGTVLRRDSSINFHLMHSHQHVISGYTLRFQQMKH